VKYRQRDIVWVNFPFTDGSTSKRRPALVVSNNAINITGDYILVQITSKWHDDIWTIALNERDYEHDPLKIQSHLRIHKIFILNETLIQSKVSSITSDRFLIIKEKLKNLFS
jgi:mRNA interferase MazF